MKTISRMTLVSAGLYFALGPTSGGPEQAGALSDTTAEVHHGRENIGYFVVPVERVDAYVPDHYQLLDDDASTTTVVVRTAEYESTTLGGRPAGRLRSAVVAVEIEPPDGNLDAANWYILYWANDNPEFNRFLRGNTPSYPVVDVPGLTCSFISSYAIDDEKAIREVTIDEIPNTENCVGQTPGGIWQSQAPPPTPSPFDMTAVVTDSVVDLGDAVGHYWVDVPEGTVRISSAVAEGDRFVLGPSAITVTASPNTPLAEVLGGPARVAELGISELTSGSYTRTLIDTDTLINSGAGADNECSPRERRAFLTREQMRILALLRSYGPESSDLTTLRDETDLLRLAQADPEAGTIYDFYPHQFVSFAGMGFAVLNTGELGPGKPDLLLYAPNPQAPDLADPYGPDFPYTLAGWGYLSPYDHEEHPRFLGECIKRGDWFVHERGVHPADTWGMVAVPPHEVEHGQEPGQDPILPTECHQEPCPAGIPHGRFWDIHLWLGDRGRPAVSILTPYGSIAGVDPEIGKNWYYPDGGTVRESNCDVVDTIVRVPVRNVRDLVPAEFVIAQNVPDQADLAIGGVHCEGVSINGGPPGETKWAYFRVAVMDPNTHELPVSDVLNSELSHTYQFWLASDNPDHVAFLRSEGGVTKNGESSQVVLVDELDWNFDPAAGTFSMEVPLPAPSPFRIEATITERVTPPGDVTVDHWAAVPRGVMELPDDNLDGLTSGLASGQVVPEAGSDMDLIFCDDTDGTFGIETGALTLFFANSSYTAVVWKPSELFGVAELSDTGPATCNPGS